MITEIGVRVPATVANVGPGFDALAFAIDWHNEIHIEPASQLEVHVEGPGSDIIERGPENLVVRAIARVIGATPRARIRIVNRFPFGRGFGSSAAAIVGGLVAGGALLGDPAASRFEDAVDLEGHADNVAAALLGGFTVSLDGTSPARLDPPPGWSALLAVAPGTLSTTAARAALPPMVTFADAAGTAGRAARLVAAIAGADIDAVFAATSDVLHQPARFELTPASGDLVAKLRSAGHAAFLSGAGPSVAAIIPAVAADRAANDAARFAPSGWDVRVVGLASSGAEIIVSD